MLTVDCVGTYSYFQFLQCFILIDNSLIDNISDISKFEGIFWQHNIDEVVEEFPFPELFNLL